MTAALSAPTDAELFDRFRPIFARIAEGAVARESERRLAHEEVRWLKEAGFGALRIPRAEGGSGASLPQLFRLLVELGEADSNLVQIWRAHFAFVEIRLNTDEPDLREQWFARIVAGQSVGAAMAERTSATETTLELAREGDRLVPFGREILLHRHALCRLGLCRRQGRRTARVGAGAHRCARRDAGGRLGRVRPAPDRQRNHPLRSRRRGREPDPAPLQPRRVPRR